ncbi:MAG: cell division protein ZapE [Woeseiaceae bacterium]|nr:cell division protein ZapE [Woeseiaceae bacterium]
MDIHKKYVTTEGIIKDNSQLRVIHEFSNLQSQLAANHKNKPFFSNPFQTKEMVKGIYLWGGVGRGKTYFMDLFFNTLETRRKRRIHFHRMMNEIHTNLKNLKETKDPIKKLIKILAKDVDVLCFDEFFVEDIADAMILQNFLEGLFEEGITLVATSNCDPDTLYQNGLQRDRFLKAIELIKSHAKIINIEKGCDYRITNNKSNMDLSSIHNKDSDDLLSKYFNEISPFNNKKNTQILINNRYINCIMAADIIVWFDFNSICSGNRSTVDYIEIAKQYQNVVISKIPYLNKSMENETRRFIALIDEFYERNVKLIYTSEVLFEDLYREKKFSFEFQRTKSRLTEMSSKKFLELAHKP